LLLLNISSWISLKIKLCETMHNSNAKQVDNLLMQDCPLVFLLYYYPGHDPLFVSAPFGVTGCWVVELLGALHGCNLQGAQASAAVPVAAMAA
jgi:hypothetical protein